MAARNQPTEGTASTEPAPETEDAKLQRLADDFARNDHIEPDYTYRYVTTGGKTIVVVEPIERKA